MEPSGNEERPDPAVVPHTRGGPKRSVPATPSRRAPGSVRRTSTIDSFRPDGLAGAVHVVARARDLRTSAGGSEVLGEARFDAEVSPERQLLALRHPDERLAALIGRTVAGGFRGAAIAAVPDEAEGRTLLNLLLDDFPGANLVAGFALQRGSDWGERRIPIDHFGPVTDLCAGWARDATILLTVRASGVIPSPTIAPVAVDPDDADGWHERPVLVAGSMRRARRLDVAPTVGADPSDLAFDAHFRDSYVDATTGEGAVHEYAVLGRYDAATHRITAIEARDAVLPWVECPQALGSAGRLVGMAADDLRALVRTDFVGTTTCTHLNDVLRSLADLPVLADAVAALRGAPT